MKLYELTDAYRKLSDLCAEGEDYQLALEQIGDELDQKVENTAKVIRELEAYQEALNAEALRISQKAGIVSNNIQRLKQYLQSNMEVASRDKVKGVVLSVTVQNSPPSCEIKDINEVPLQLRTSTLTIPSVELPEDMMHYRTGEMVDKKEVIRMWKEEIDVPGTSVTRGKHVVIR